MLRSVLLAATLTASPASAQMWVSAPSLSTPRSDAAAAVLDGRIYVVGGRAAGGQVLRSGEVYTPGQGWAPIAALDDPRAGARLLAFDGRLYLVGGNDGDGPEDDLDVYDPATNTWDSEDSMEEERDALAAGVIAGRLYVLGGADDNGVLLSDAEAFDRVADQWAPVSEWSLSPARASAGSAVDGSGVVVAGGFSQLGPLAVVERFVPGASSVSLPSLPSARGGVALAAAGATLFAVGGRDASDSRLASALRLDPAAPMWASLPTLPEGRESAAAVILDEDLYVIGGTGAFGSVLGSVLRLDDAAVSTDEAPADRSLQIVLDGPMPARQAVHLRVSAARPDVARVAVYDLQGRELGVLYEGPLDASERRLTWNTQDHPAGLYLVRITTQTAARSLSVATVPR